MEKPRTPPKCKKPKEFKPLKTPRYLPGQVETAVLVNDLIMYNKHKHEIFYAKARVDHLPLPMNPRTYLNFKRMANDSFRLREIDKENKQMIRRINIINRMGGFVDTFNRHGHERHSKWRKHELEMLELVKANVDFYRKITKAKSDYGVEQFDEFWKEVVHKLKYTCKFPIVFLSHQTLDQRVAASPSISSGLSVGSVPVERPLVYMDFRVKEGVYLGRIVIELYHDFVPVTVENFISICCNEDDLTYQNCIVHRAIPGEVIETGDITKGNGKGGTSIYGDTFAEENHELKHSKPGQRRDVWDGFGLGHFPQNQTIQCHHIAGGITNRIAYNIYCEVFVGTCCFGVLSTIRVGNKVNNSQFSITLQPMSKFDGNRVVFGKVIRGNETLCKISDLGKRYGSPSVPIYIYECGKFIKGKTAVALRSFKYELSFT